jgi:hypothetical protein
VKGLMVNVYRSLHFNCTMGVTSTHDTVLLVGEGIPGVSESDGMDLPILKVVRRNICGREHIHAEPIEDPKGNRMFGGNFVYSSDSRFPSDYPIPVHDRVESNGGYAD